MIGNFIFTYILGQNRVGGPRVLRRLVALLRYLSYRGFHIRALRWNTAPVGLLILGAIGTTYFFCKPRPNRTKYVEPSLPGCSAYMW